MGEARNFEEPVEERAIFGESFGEKGGEGGGGPDRNSGELVPVVADPATSGEEMEERRDAVEVVGREDALEDERFLASKHTL